MKLSVKLVIGFSLIIILSIFDSYIDYKLSREVTKNAHFLTNSEAVIRYSTTLHKSIIEMQSGFRGYILTSNEHFLEPYYEGLMEIPHHFNSLDSLIDENPGQMAKLRFIKKLHNQWIQYADQIIVAKEEMDFSGKK